MVKFSVVFIFLLIFILVPFASSANDFAFNRLYDGSQPIDGFNYSINVNHSLTSDFATLAGLSNSTNNWITLSLGILDDVNTTQLNNEGGTLTIDPSYIDANWCALTGCIITGDLEVDGVISQDGLTLNDTYINKAGDSFNQQTLELNFTFSNLSLPILENFNGITIKNLNDSSASSLAVQNDGDISVSLFSSGSNFLTGLNLNNSAGVASTNTDLILATRSIGTNIVFQVINSSGIPIDTLVVEGDGNVILQNDLIMNGSKIFLDGAENHFIRENIDGFPFNGIAKNATWFGHDFMRDEGEITYLFSWENNTQLFLQAGRNNSFSAAGNSFGLIPQYMAEENFTENGVINMTKASDYVFLCNFFGVDCSFNADTRGNALDNISGGPLLFTMGDFEVWQSVKIHEGIAVEGPADFDLEGFDANFNNGSVHPTTPVTFEQGFDAGDSVRKFIETFASNLGIFTNLQTDLGDWVSVLSTTFCDEGQCAQADGAGTGFVAMQTNVSTLDVNETTLSFVYSLFNLIGSGEISVVVNNNVGSGDVTIFTDTTDNVIQGSQSIALPSSMDNQTLISITVNCDVASAAKPTRQCFFDTAKLNGTAITTTTINVSGFDSVMAFSDGALAADGFPERGIFYVAENDTIVIRGNATFENIIEQDLNITSSITLNSTTIEDWGDIPNFLNLDGSNADTTIDIGSEDFVTTGIAKFGTDALAEDEAPLTLQSHTFFTDPEQGKIIEFSSLMGSLNSFGIDVSRIPQYFLSLSSDLGFYIKYLDVDDRINFNNGDGGYITTEDENGFNFSYDGGPANIFTGPINATGLITGESLDIDTLNLNGNIISDSTGEISFDNENLATLGKLTIGDNSGTPLTLNVETDDDTNAIIFDGWNVGGGVVALRNIQFAPPAGGGASAPFWEIENAAYAGKLSVINIDNSGASLTHFDFTNDFGNPSFGIELEVGTAGADVSLLTVNGDVNGTGDIYIEGNYNHQGNVGFTGSCINITYSGGIAITCND